MKYKSVLLLILDGWGFDKTWGGNAITSAETPNYNKIIREFPNTLINASGQNVGLPGHEVGNSEVGHMNLGAGNIVVQDISEINQSLQNGTFYKNPVLNDAISASKNNDTCVHLMGIVSDGGIHSHINHLLALIKLCSMIGHKKVFIHAFTDGRDTPTEKGLEFINTLKFVCDKLKTGLIATIMGRVFLDRKGDWPKTQKAYEAIVNGVGTKEKDPRTAISNSYRHGMSDEYIEPVIIGGAESRVKDGDTIIFFNFRSDRTRQLTRAFMDPKLTEFRRVPLKNIDFITFIPYGIELEMGIKGKSAFKTVSIARTLGKYFELLNMKQFHIAETEKYAHVTFFINGNRNEPYAGEDRILVPSPNVRSYAETPQMSVDEVTANLTKHLKRSLYSLLICNFANPDMIGHTGNFNAAVAAVQILDGKIKEVMSCCVNNNIPLIITADHGNIECMVNPKTLQPHTEHTKNPVPFIVVSDQKDILLAEGGKLGNVAPTLLDLFGVKIPEGFLPSLLSRRANPPVGPNSP